MKHDRSHSTLPTFAIDALLTPAAFGHSVERLELRETHVSWLVLTGSFVYKIKKPVRFDFLDASDLETRRHLCQEELRLNRRLAPELYVDVVPIIASQEGLHAGGHGTIVEYAVRMRQFPAGEELQALLAADRIGVTDLVTLAELLSRFHARAPVAQWRGRSIHANRLLDAALVNSSELIAQLQEVAPEIYLGKITLWLTEHIERDQALFERRERWGYIR